nr:NBS-containing resistance-like protein [Tanacetum cinerariifolium]
MLPPPPILKSPFHALRDPNWKQAMCDEYKALIDNNTWVVVARPPNINIVHYMWLYKYKYNVDGSLNWYKARLVANGRSQQQGIEYDETFSPVVKPSTIRTVLSLAVSCLFTKYATEILEQAKMLNYNPCRTPIDIEKKLGPEGSSDTLSHSSAEAEYRRVANVVAETSWIRNLLRELHTSLFIATLVYCDNVSVVYMSATPVQHQRTKHIEIDIHFVRDKVAACHVRVLHVPSRFQYAYIFTKGLSYPLFADFRSSLNVHKTPALTAGAYYSTYYI